MTSHDFKQLRTSFRAAKQELRAIVRSVWKSGAPKTNSLGEFEGWLYSSGYSEMVNKVSSKMQRITAQAQHAACVEHVMYRTNSSIADWMMGVRRLSSAGKVRRPFPWGNRK